MFRSTTERRGWSFVTKFYSSLFVAVVNGSCRCAKRKGYDVARGLSVQNALHRASANLPISAEAPMRIVAYKSW